MLDTVLGLADRLVTKDSVVWECTNCDNCFDHCPQDVRPVEVILAIKNMIHQAGLSPKNVEPLVASVANTGCTVAMSDLINKRRRELGLPELIGPPVDELQKILGDKKS